MAYFYVQLIIYVLSIVSVMIFGIYGSVIVSNSCATAGGDAMPSQPLTYGQNIAGIDSFIIIIIIIIIINMYIYIYVCMYACMYV